MAAVAFKVHFVDAPRKLLRHRLCHLHTKAGRVDGKAGNALGLPRHLASQKLLLGTERKIVECLAIDEIVHEPHLDILMVSRSVLTSGDVITGEARRIRVSLFDLRDVFLA